MQRNRLLLLAAALAAAVIVVVVLVVVVGSGGGKQASTTTTSTGTTPATTASLFAGVPQHGDTLGKPGALVTLTVFEDPQCPFCAEWNIDTLPTVISRYVKPGRVKLAYRGIEIIGPNSEPGLRAIYAAGVQNKLWTMADELYRRQGKENSGWITPAVIAAAAGAIGANPTAIRDDANSAGVTAALIAATKEATADAVQGTPTFVIEQPPGLPQQLSVPALDPATFTSVLDAALQ
jgi:protein-disulfide isomerase